jgi:cold shock CspA family protein
MSLRGKLFGNIPDEPITSEDLSEDILKNRITGKIFFLNEDEGWGFISSNDLKFTRIFFHWSALEQDTFHFTQLKKGMEVEFTPKEYEERGWRAIRIKVINEVNKDA